MTQPEDLNFKTLVYIAIIFILSQTSPCKILLKFNKN